MLQVGFECDSDGEYTVDWVRLQHWRELKALCFVSSLSMVKLIIFCMRALKISSIAWIWVP